MHVPCQILCGPVPFLVGGDAVGEEELHPQSGIRQGDPLSPILFSLITSPVIYMMASLGATLWLYSEYALRCFPCASDEAEDRLHAVRAIFDEFGGYTCLRLNLKL